MPPVPVRVSRMRAGVTGLNSPLGSMASECTSLRPVWGPFGSAPRLGPVTGGSTPLAPPVAVGAVGAVGARGVVGGVVGGVVEGVVVGTVLAGVVGVVGELVDDVCAPTIVAVP